MKICMLDFFIMKLEPYTYYQHRYGGLYQTQRFVTSKSTVDQSEWVAYMHVWPFEVAMWHRPIEEFTDGRFRELTDSEAFVIMRTTEEAEFKEIIAANKAAAKIRDDALEAALRPQFGLECCV